MVLRLASSAAPLNWGVRFSIGEKSLTRFQFLLSIVVLSISGCGIEKKFDYQISTTPYDSADIISKLKNLENALVVYRLGENRSCGSSPVVCFKYSCASAHTELQIMKNQVLLNSDEKARQLAVFTEVVGEFFVRYYPYPVEIIIKRPGYIFLKPPVNQGYVLKKRKLWEQLEIKIIATVTDSTISTSLILDGRYAAGLNAPKAQSDFIDFEVDYPKQFSEYAEELSTKLQDFLATNDKSVNLACASKFQSFYLRREKIGRRNERKYR